MKAFYYLVAVVLALYFFMQIIFDIWLYRTTKNLDLVLDVLFYRNKKTFCELTANQTRFHKYLGLLERVAIGLALFVFVIELLKLLLIHR